MATSNIPYLGDLISTSVASYGDLSGANFDQAKLSLALSKSGSNANFTQKQADVFSKQYVLVDQLPNIPNNGFSAAVFLDRVTNRHESRGQVLKSSISEWRITGSGLEIKHF